MNIRKLSRTLLAATLLFAGAVAHAEESLYAQIGGEPKLRASVDKLVEIMLVDERINFTFAETDLAKFKGLLYDQICELTGGPCKYTGRDMIESHKKLNTTNEQFNALAEDLYKAFDEVGVPYRLQNRVMALLAPMQPQVVDKVPLPK
ncbi:MAG: group 1 truncated hemoglobin [Steroidobacteraceae bacterium]|nr:group 1 truncated hemoglobin [Steroidobacteraceae bacterium]